MRAPLEGLLDPLYALCAPFAAHAAAATAFFFSDHEHAKLLRACLAFIASVLPACFIFCCACRQGRRDKQQRAGGGCCACGGDVEAGRSYTRLGTLPEHRPSCCEEFGAKVSAAVRRFIRKCTPLQERSMVATMLLRVQFATWHEQYAKAAKIRRALAR